MERMSKKELENTSFGLRLILAERWRQVSENGFTAWFDQTHNKDLELLKAARCYFKNALEPEIPVGDPSNWPWNTKYWKPSSHVNDEGRIKDLIKAGAFLVAEHDRRCDNYKAFTGRAFDKDGVTAFCFPQREDNDPDYMANLWIKEGFNQIDRLLDELGGAKKRNGKKRGCSLSEINQWILTITLYASAAIRDLFRKIGNTAAFTVPPVAVDPIDAILANYKKVAVVKDYVFDVNIFRPASMGTLPVCCMRLFIDSILGSSIIDPKKYYRYNPDYGSWDAKVLVKFDVDTRATNPIKAVSVYFCSLLIRPFSQEALSFYSDGYMPIFRRAEHIFDSRKYDKENGFKAVYGFINDDTAEQIMRRQKKDDIMEGDGLNS